MDTHTETLTDMQTCRQTEQETWMARARGQDTETQISCQANTEKQTKRVLERDTR